MQARGSTSATWTASRHTSGCTRSISWAPACPVMGALLQDIVAFSCSMLQAASRCCITAIRQAVSTCNGRTAANPRASGSAFHPSAGLVTRPVCASRAAALQCAEPRGRGGLLHQRSCALARLARPRQGAPLQLPPRRILPARSQPHACSLKATQNPQRLLPVDCPARSGAVLGAA